MLESMKQYPSLWLLAAILLVVAVVVLVLAHNSKKRGGDSPERLLSAKDIEKLRVSFSHMTAEKLETVHGREMVYAVITNMEAKLDQEQPFETLKKEQQYVYTLWFFVQTFSQGKGMCQFFREFEKPLTALIIPALMELDEPKLTGIVHDAYNAFDENNETSSSNQQTVCALDEAFENEFDRITFYEKTEQYIRSNLNCFLDV